MGFDVHGPTRHICAANLDDGSRPRYDLLYLPRDFSLRCPQLERLSDRFYASTRLSYAGGEVEMLRDELVRLSAAYRQRRGEQLARERRITAKDPVLRQAAIDRLLAADPVFTALSDFLRLCDEALAAAADLRCEGD